MISHSMTRMMRVEASTKRASMVSGKRSAPVEYLASIMIMPLDPIGMAESRDRLQRMGLESPIDLYQTVTSGDHDVIKGDILVVSDVDYPIRDIEPWSAELGTVGADYLRLIVEKVKP